MKFIIDYEIIRLIAQFYSSVKGIGIGKLFLKVVKINCFTSFVSKYPRVASVKISENKRLNAL